MTMLPEILVVAVLPALLAAAAGWDLASYTIPNALQIALIAAFAVFALASGLPAAAIGIHLLAGLMALLLGFALFAGGFIGGGDAKLFAATALWFGFWDLAQFALMASILGGALTLALLGLRRLPLPARLASQAWVARLHDARSAVPYGVALAAGALLVLPHTELRCFAGRYPGQRRGVAPGRTGSTPSRR